MEYKAKLPAIVSALLLTIAAACVWAFGTYMVVESYDDYVKHQRPQPYHPYERVAVSPEGTPLIAVNNHGGNDVEQILKIDRSAISRETVPAIAQQATLPEHRERDTGGGRRHGNRFVLLEYKTKSTGEPDVRPENWYFVLNDVRTGRGWLEGYDRATRERIGFIGRNGLSAEPPAESDQFAPAPGELLRGTYQRCLLEWQDFFRIYGDHNSSAVHFDGKYPVSLRECLILDDAGVHLIDLQARTASVLVPGPVESMAAASQLEPLPEGFVIDDPQDHWKEDRRYLLKIRLAIRTKESVQLLDLVRDQQRELNLPTELQTKPIDLMLLGDGGAVARTSTVVPLRSVGNGLDAVRMRLTWFQPDGRVARQEDVDYWRSSSTFSAEAGMLMANVAMPAPLASTILVCLNTAFMSDDAAASGFLQRLSAVIRAMWPGILLALASGLLGCWLLERHRRRHRLPRDMRWLVFAFLLGVPGFVGYVWHRRWPPVQLAPAPELTGIEIVAA